MCYVAFSSAHKVSVEVNLKKEEEEKKKVNQIGLFSLVNFAADQDKALQL